MSSNSPKKQTNEFVVEQKSGVILTSTEPNFFTMLFSIKNQTNTYDVVSLPVPLVGQKTCPPREILTWLFITENAL